MPHPLASHLAPLIDRDIEELRGIIARFIVSEPTPAERARYRRFGAELGGLKARLEARKIPPSDEEVELALSTLLVLAGASPEGDEADVPGHEEE